MGKANKTATIEEVQRMPALLNAEQVAKLVGCNVRYVQTHPDEFLGRKIANVWRFPKPALLELLGLKMYA